MAAEKLEDEPILKGSTLPIRIEDVIADVLVVCLEHGAKIYRGILLDSTKRDMPYGVGFDQFRLQKEKSAVSAEQQTVVVDPNTDVGSLPGVGAGRPGGPEVTALSARHTYCQDPNTPDPRLLLPPRRTLVKPIRDGKNVRNMRLRPRKVLCSNCNQGIHDNEVKGNTTSVDSTTTTCQQNQNQTQSQTKLSNNIEKTVAPSRLSLRMSLPPRPGLRMSLRGKRKPEEEEDVADVPVAPIPKRPRQQQQPRRHQQQQQQHQLPIARVVTTRINPIIKISFTSPQGEVHTSKVQTSRSAEERAETEPEESPRPQPHEHESFDYRKLKRALKKAKLKDRAWEEASCISEVSTTVPDENTMRHHKKSKRSKHKRKHKHRSAIQSPVHDPNSDEQNENNSDFENNAANAAYTRCDQAKDEVSERKAKEVEDWDSSCHHVYHEASPYPKENSHFKENSINMPPRQQPTPTRPFHSPHDLPPYMEADAQTFTPRSPYANRSSCANSQIGSVSPSSNFETDDEGDMPPAGDEFPTNEPEELEEARLRPLMMKIHTKTVNMGFLPDGRHVRVGEVVWGKIHGFPWWPGKILSITVSQRDNGTVITQMAHIAWCGSSTMSHMPCSELFPFLEDFKNRYNKKKKGPYKNAIKEATRIAQGLVTSQTLTSSSPSPGDRDQGVLDVGDS